MLNAKTARSQLIGGITYGIGMALLEETLVDGETGRIVNTNVAEYLMPVNADVPEIQTIVVPNDDTELQSAWGEGDRGIADGGRRGGDRERGVSRDRGAGAEGADPDRGRSGVELEVQLLLLCSTGVVRNTSQQPERCAVVPLMGSRAVGSTVRL